MPNVRLGRDLCILGGFLFALSSMTIYSDRDFEIRTLSYIVIPQYLYSLSLISISLFATGIIANHYSLYNIVGGGYKFLITMTFNNIGMQFLGLYSLFIGLTVLCVHVRINRLGTMQ